MLDHIQRLGQDRETDDLNLVQALEVELKHHERLQRMAEGVPSSLAEILDCDAEREDLNDIFYKASIHWGESIMDEIVQHPSWTEYANDPNTDTADFKKIQPFVAINKFAQWYWALQSRNSLGGIHINIVFP